MSATTFGKNAYYCEDCKGYVVTIDVDQGVTPMFLRCRATPGCKGMSKSMMYPKEPWPAVDGFGAPIPTEPTYEWYRPGKRERRRLDADSRHHVGQGGLLLRPVAQPSGVIDSKEGRDA